MAALYSVLELSTAVKPWLLRHLLNERGVERITYLDPDIEVRDSLEEVDALLREHHLVLNPHLTSPMPRDGAKPSESDILIAGSFNLGFVGLAAGRGHRFPARLVGGAAGDRLPRRPRARLLRRPALDGLRPRPRALARGPARPGLQRRLLEPARPRAGRAGDGSYTAGGRPLRFMHYSGFDPATPDVLSKHQTRVRVADDPVLAGAVPRLRAALARRRARRGARVGLHVRRRCPTARGSTSTCARSTGRRSRRRGAAAFGLHRGGRRPSSRPTCAGRRRRRATRRHALPGRGARGAGRAARRLPVIGRAAARSSWPAGPTPSAATRCPTRQFLFPDRGRRGGHQRRGPARWRGSTSPATSPRCSAWARRRAR